MKEIESIRNPQIQALRKLSRTRERREQGRFLVEGPRMAEEALAAGWCELLLVSHLTERNAAVAEKAEQTGIEVIRVSEAVMESLSENRTPQGILCVCRMPAQAKMPDAVQNPGNVGTMIRTADAAGFAGIVLGPGCADLYSPKTLASTMGSVFHLPIVTVEDLPGMHIRQGRTNLPHNLVANASFRFPLGQESFEGSPVHPFHLNAIAERRVLYE